MVKITWSNIYKISSQVWKWVWEFFLASISIIWSIIWQCRFIIGIALVLTFVVLFQSNLLFIFSEVFTFCKAFCENYFSRIRILFGCNWQCFAIPPQNFFVVLFFIFSFVFLIFLFWEYLLKYVWKQAVKDKQFTFVFILTLTLVFSLIFGIFLPLESSFEGILLVNSFGFTNQNQGQLLLENLEQIQGISLAGQLTFTLPATITNINPNHPEFNKIQDKIQELQIELDKEGGQITITPNTPKEDIIIKAIRLQKKDKIKDLQYTPYIKSTPDIEGLDFQLIPGDSAQPPKFFIDASSSIKISLSHYQITNINLKNPEVTLEFTLSPDQFLLKPNAETKVDLTWSKHDLGQTQIFQDNIEVQDVEFIARPKKLHGEEELSYSRILSGDIRMANQNLKLEKKQFLTIASPGIQTLNRIQIVQPDPDHKLELKTSGDNLKLADPDTGLNISISGKTTQIQAGLNKDLPIVQIQGSWLSQHLSRDGVVAIISFCASLVVSLIAWLFKKMDDSPNP